MVDRPRYDRVILFAGHMIDKPGRRPHRFPPAMESLAAREIAKALQASVAQGTGSTVAISSAACGGDIIFLEACTTLGVTHVISLPFAPAHFRLTSVAGFGGRWV